MWTVDGGDLHRRDESHAEFGGGLAGALHTVDRVVVAHREQLDARLPGRGEDVARLERAVGVERGALGVEGGWIRAKVGRGWWSRARGGPSRGPTRLTECPPSAATIASSKTARSARASRPSSCARSSPRALRGRRSLARARRGRPGRGAAGGPPPPPAEAGSSRGGWRRALTTGTAARCSSA